VTVRPPEHASRRATCRVDQTDSRSCGQQDGSTGLAIADAVNQVAHAMGIKLEATLPTGERAGLVETSAPASRRRAAKAA
jgi:hypothetical protein